jgi:hypothetical protein
MMINTDTSGITIVAWWGAILSTIILAWDIYKWRTSGPKLRVTIQTGMLSFNIPEYEGKQLVTVNVTNYGNQPTTITTLGFKFYPNILFKIRNKHTKAFIIPEPNTMQPTPFELKQGNLWNAIVVQTSDLVDMARSGHLICELYHSHQEKPVRRRVVIGALADTNN